MGAAIVVEKTTPRGRRCEPRDGRRARLGAVAGHLSFRVQGDYFESCNCEAICPCRMVGGVPGGRSTYGVCFGALLADRQGNVDATSTRRLERRARLPYDDDESGSPWRCCSISTTRSDEQRAALGTLFLGGHRRAAHCRGSARRAT